WHPRLAPRRTVPAPRRPAPRRHRAHRRPPAGTTGAPRRRVRRARMVLRTYCPAGPRHSILVSRLVVAPPLSVGETLEASCIDSFPGGSEGATGRRGSLRVTTPGEPPA